MLRAVKIHSLDAKDRGSDEEGAVSDCNELASTAHLVQEHAVSDTP